MTTTEKMTNKKALAYILETATDIPADVREKLENMLTSLEKKGANGEKQMTERQKENIILREELFKFLASEPDLVVSCSDLIKKIPLFENLSTQRVASLLLPLTKSGQVAKIKEHGKIFYQYAKGEEG